MKFTKIMILDIVLALILSGTSIVVAIKSIVDKASQERKEEKFHEEITRLTMENTRLATENSKKSDSIITLQSELKEQNRLLEKKLRNPIPVRGSVTVESTINLNNLEIDSILTRYREHGKGGNLLGVSNIGFFGRNQSLEEIVRGSARFWLKFTTEEKSLSFFKTLPHGYISDHPLKGNSFLSISDSMKAIKFDMFNIDFSSNDISSNTSSLYDFRRCNVSFVIQFFGLKPLLPVSKEIGSVMLSRDEINIDLLKIIFNDGKNCYTIDSFKNSGIPNEFSTDFEFKLV